MLIYALITLSTNNTINQFEKNINAKEIQI